MGHKHDELELCVQLQGYNHPGIMEMWWECCNGGEDPGSFKQAGKIIES